MLEELDLHAFELWKTFQTFIQLDPNLPRQLREHFLDIERQLTLHLIWQKNTIVVKKLQEIIARNEREELQQEYGMVKPQESSAVLLDHHGYKGQQTAGSEEGKIKPAQETFAQIHAREQAEEKALNQFKMFFNRVKQIAANTI